tara:strand:- start:115 stop:1347 length:1233 start_codon:yes stop_codon:yes gene_type:complete
MIRSYLILIDAIVPILIGYIIVSLLVVDYIDVYIMHGFILVTFSIVKGFYEDYYSKHFSEKIRISFITSITLIFSQMIYFSYYGININIVIVTSWALIPIIILYVRYILKINNRSINNSAISIIGNLYKFTDHEIKILTDKKYKVYFYNELSQYIEDLNVNHDDSDIAVINMNTLTSQNMKLLSSANTISLGKFMENYLRKIYIDEKDVFKNINKYSKSNLIFKKMIDYTAVMVLLPILIVVSIYVIIMQFLKGYGGNFIFIQKRYGKNYNVFSLYKLRTMHIDSDMEGNTVKNDQRIYPFAKGLRKYRLDELPQLINIIRGDMHLVGPRAEWVKLSDKYSENIDNYALRNIVMPGITGWAQVLYQYGFDINDSKQKLMYELYYIKNWTVWLELEICIKTITVILDKKGF